MEVRPGYKQTEVGVIPEDWEVKPLGTVAGYTNGKAHEGSISDFGKYVVVNSKFISTAGEVKKYSNQRFSPALKGEILMVMSDVPNGRAIARCFFVDRDDLYTVNQRICALRPLHVDGRLLLYRLNRNPFYLAFDDGVKQTNLRKDDVLSCPLALPSTKAEHEAIAVALTDADALIESLEQLLTKKRQIKKGAMQELLTGEKRLPGFSGAWTIRRIDEISDVDPENLPSMTKQDFKFNYISLEQVDSGRLLSHSEVEFGAAPSRARRVLRHGDVLMSTVRPNLKAHLLYLEQIPNAVCSTGFAVLRTKSNVSDPGFIFAQLFGHSVNEQIEENLAGSNYPAINRREVRRLEVACPLKVEEQTAIATILSDMDTEITALEAKLSKAHLIKQGMMQELLTGKIRLL